MRHVVFALHGDRYALPLGAVREVVVAPDAFTRVPFTSPPVRGVMTLRGRVVPVVDLARLLTAQTGDGGKVVLLELPRRELGLLVSEVAGVEHIDKVSPGVKPAPPIKGVARLAALTVTVLDPDALDELVNQAFCEAGERGSAPLR